VMDALDTRITESSADQRQHIALTAVASLDLEGQVISVRSSSAILASAVEPLVEEKLAVLESTGALAGKLRDQEDVVCPACGQTVSVDALQAHVKDELERLNEIVTAYDSRKTALGVLCSTVNELRSRLGEDCAKKWRADHAGGSLAENLAYLESFDAESFRTSCSEDDVATLEGSLLPIVEAARTAAQDAPTEAEQLVTDRRLAETGKLVIGGVELDSDVARAEALVGYVKSLEQGVREEIRLRSKAVIEDISSDIRIMWGILHPGEPIEDVNLCVPEGADKAIDIALKFHGVEQDSPRLTLSEGYRNSLGLAIFLAMAKRNTEVPVYLDDVVVSLDRGHRGMIVELLEKEFKDRQVIVLTHDRDWYAELRMQLDKKDWAFGALLPYESPEVGIRWSHGTTTFDDARGLLANRPDAAGNDARKIMDVELALVAERLQIRFPYLRGEKNDKRLAHDFLSRLIASGKKCFQKKASQDYVLDADAIDAMEAADRLIVSWGNRASHSHDLVCPEATKLIDACEAALDAFKCSACGKNVWYADVQNAKLVQCQCGELRWRYGKG
jgi:transcription initiation factor IIE alpha subunit